MAAANQQSSGKANLLDNYVTVAERIEKFYAQYPEGRILTQIVDHDRESGFVLIRAEVYRHVEDANPSASGHAYEYKDAGYVQRTSYIETCETSAVGRALAFLNFETKRAIASDDEVKAARQAESPLTPHLRTAPATQSSTTGELKELHGRISTLHTKLLQERHVKQPQLDQMLRQFGANTVAELDQAQAREHLAEVSELLNRCIAEKAARLSKAGGDR